MNKYSKELVKIILEIEALKLSVKNPFLWASGYYMPVYNDNRVLLQEKKYRSMIADAFVSIMVENGIMADVITGTSTSGIPFATTLADKLDLPLTYVRSKPKLHGLKNRIEGLPADKGYEGRKIVLIEDLVSTGGSSIEAVNAVREAGGDIEFCLSIFNYGLEKGAENFASLDPACRTIPILTYGELILKAAETGYVDKRDIESLREWRKAPFEWGEKNGLHREA